MSADSRYTTIAHELYLLGVSNQGVIEILRYPLERIERQLDYLPYRNSNRPAGMILEAVRHDYSPPKEYYFAKAQEFAENPGEVLDESAEPVAGRSDANAHRYRAKNLADSSSPIGWLSKT